MTKDTVTNDNPAKRPHLDLTGHFLIAMPNLDDPFFAKSVILICTHNADGAMGVIINQPTDMLVGELYEKIKVPLGNEDLAKQTVLFGGPVQPDRGFVLHPLADTNTDDWDSCISVGEHVALTTSKDILQAVGQGDGPKKFLLSLGYAGWTAGQLEDEMLKNAWLSVETTDLNVMHNILYETDYDDMFELTINLLGIDPSMLSGVAGNA